MGQMSGVCQQQQPTGAFTSTWLLKTKKSHLFLILLLVLLLVFLLIFLLVFILLILLLFLLFLVLLLFLEDTDERGLKAQRIMLTSCP